MFPENVKWDAVFHSIVDTWLPLAGAVVVIIIIAIVIYFINKKK